MLYLPNLLTILRLVLVVPTVIALQNEDFGAALALLLIAGLSDGLDGYLARRFDWHTRLGAILDPLADKIFAVSIYLTLGSEHLVPRLLVALVVGRDLVIVLGAAIYRWLFGPIAFGARVLSKLNTVLQVGLALVVVAAAATAWVPRPVLTAFVWAVAFLTVASGVDYVIVWGARAMAARKHD